MKRILTIFLAILMISYPVTYSVAYANTLEEDRGNCPRHAEYSYGVLYWVQK